jgi:hypothetical protein
MPVTSSQPAHKPLKKNRSNAATLSSSLLIAVQVAQTYGIRVHILAVGDPKNNVSPTLQMEADSVGVVGGDWLKPHVEIVTQKNDGTKATGSKTSAPPTQAAPAPASAPSVEVAAGSVCDELLASGVDLKKLRDHFESNKTVPPEYDGRLIAKTGGLLNRQLTPDEKRKVRGVFVRRVRATA